MSLSPKHQQQPSTILSQPARERQDGSTFSAGMHTSLLSDRDAYQSLTPHVCYMTRILVGKYNGRLVFGGQWNTVVGRSVSQWNRNQTAKKLFGYPPSIHPPPIDCSIFERKNCETYSYYFCNVNTCAVSHSRDWENDHAIKSIESEIIAHENVFRLLIKRLNDKRYNCTQVSHHVYF